MSDQNLEYHVLELTDEEILTVKHALELLKEKTILRNPGNSGEIGFVLELVKEAIDITESHRLADNPDYQTIESRIRKEIEEFNPTELVA